ncbi:MAG: CHAT domain-containing protein [Cyanobacteria bacterium P01_A01_bin.116]
MVKTILLLAANPQNASRLKLDEEMRDIREGLQRTRHRNDFKFVTRWVARPRDFRREMLANTPQIVHFIAHGKSEGLAFEDVSGNIRLISSNALSTLFKLVSNHVECVVLSGCYSKIQAEEIAQSVPYVIGSKPSVDNRSEIEFAVAFYEALGNGESIEFAYESGLVAMQLIGSSEVSIPTLLKGGSSRKLEEYDQALTRYELEVRKILQSASSSSSLKRLREVLGLIDEDAVAIEAEIRETNEINLAIETNSIRNYKRLSIAILRKICVTESVPISEPEFIEGSLWEIMLPSTGLELTTRKAIFFLSHDDNISQLDAYLKKIGREREIGCFVFASISGNFPERFNPFHIIRINSKSLKEMNSIAEKDRLVWLARFFFRQINIVALPGMLPYKTNGPARLFFGRENELSRLTSNYQKGAILVGAHRSGKSSLLEKIKERFLDRKYKVVGPLTFFKLQQFFKETLDPLGEKYRPTMSIEDWRLAVKEYNKQENHLIFMMDEVDRMIDEDSKTSFQLGHTFRALQNEGVCEFFLAGHARLREAIRLEGSPFRNFAEEITLTGLSEESALELIQTPMKLLGFEVPVTYAKRIYHGTAGVAVLIQEFCRRLLEALRQDGNSEIDEVEIEDIEQDPDFLQAVFEHYNYAHSKISISIVLITAIKQNVRRKDILEVFLSYGIKLPRERLDEALNFLTRFGVLQQFKAGQYRILSGYLIEAILAQEPESLLDSKLEGGVDE